MILKTEKVVQKEFKEFRLELCLDSLGYWLNVKQRPIGIEEWHNEPALEYDKEMRSMNLSYAQCRKIYARRLQILGLEDDLKEMQQELATQLANKDVLKEIHICNF